MSMYCELDVHPEIWDLTGTLTGEVIGPNGEPCKAVHVDQSMKIKVTVELGGRILHYLCNTQIGVSLAFESCGSGVEGEWCKWLTIEPCKPGGNTLVFEFEVGRGVLSTSECGRQYEICITVGSKDCCGKVGFIFGTCHDFNITVLPADVN